MLSALLALAFLKADLGAATPAPENAEKPVAGDSRQRFTSFIAGIWESLPPVSGPNNRAFLDLQAGGTGTMVIRLTLPGGERTIVSRVAWAVGASARSGDPVLRFRYVRSTEAALNPGPTTESAILEANQLTLKTQTSREEPQTFVRREQLPPEIRAAIAQANLPETTIQESQIK